MPPSLPPVIIGGGVAGLLAAAHLAERGLQPILLEANPVWLGGRLRDTESAQFEQQNQIWTFPGEHGIHGIWSPYINFKAALARFDITPTFHPAREETWIFGRGQTIRYAAVGRTIRNSLVPAPFHYLHLFLRPRFLNILHLRDIAAMFRVLGSLFSAMSIDPLAEHKALQGMSLADFMAGWSPTLQNFFAGLARNALAHHPSEVPASGFIAFLRFYTLLRRDAWIFDYLPDSGGTAVIQPLTEAAQRLGADIRLGANVTKLGQNADQSWQVTYQTATEQVVINAPQVILATDAPAAQHLLQTSPSTAAEIVKFYFPQGIPTAIIRLWFGSKPKRGSESGMFTGDFIMDNFFWLDQLQTVYQEWGRVTGGSAVEMHIYGPPERLVQPDASLLAQVMVDLYRAFPELRGRLLHSVLQRNEATHSLFGVGPVAQHLAIETPWPNLFACGDWVYDPNPALYLERAATTSLKASNAVLEAMGRDPWPILLHPEPEWLAGKIEKGLRGIRRWLTTLRECKKRG